MTGVTGKSGDEKRQYCKTLYYTEQMVGHHLCMQTYSAIFQLFPLLHGVLFFHHSLSCAQYSLFQTLLCKMYWFNTPTPINLIFQPPSPCIFVMHIQHTSYMQLKYNFKIYYLHYYYFHYIFLRI